MVLTILHYISFISPYLSYQAGLIALIWSKNPELTPNEVEYILKRSTDNVGIQTLWNSPYGRINSFNAVSAAGSGTPFVSIWP